MFSWLQQEKENYKSVAPLGTNIVHPQTLRDPQSGADKGLVHSVV